MAYFPNNPNGQTTMANSAPVTIASDQSSLLIAGSSATGAAVPANAFYLGILGGGGLLRGVASVGGIGADGDGGGNTVATSDFVYNGTSYDRTRSMGGISAGSSTGLLAAGIAGGLMPLGTALNTYSIHLTSNGTTTPTSSTAYISSIAISAEVGGTTSSITIQDKQGTPLKLINGLATTAVTTAPTVLSFNTPLKMVNGIDIITAGAVAGTVDVWINYYQ